MSKSQEHAEQYAAQMLDEHMMQILSLKYGTGPEEIRHLIHVYFEIFDNTYRSMAGLDDEISQDLLLVEVGERLTRRGVYGSDLKRQFGQIVCDFLLFHKLQRLEKWMVSH